MGSCGSTPALEHCIVFLSNKSVELIVLIYLFKVINSITSYKKPFTLIAQHKLFA